MQKHKKIRIFALAIGVLLLFFFIFIPLLGHIGNSYLDRHPSEIPPSNWKKFSSDEGKFSVLFPGTPEEKVEPVSGSFGNAEIHYFAVWADKQTLYGINYSDSSKYLKVNPQELFKKTQNLTVENQKGTIVFEQETTVDGFPAKEFEFIAGGKANSSFRIREILVGQRVYEVITVFLTTNPHPVNRDIFFNSFHVQN